MSGDPTQIGLRPDQLKKDTETCIVYGRDWTRVHAPSAKAVAFPESTADVQRIVQWAMANRMWLVPSGGRTGLAGGAVASRGELVVSMDRMNQILELNAYDRFVRCQAGVVTEALQNHVRDAGFYFPVDFASRGSSHIGGNIATNAGGVNVVRYGMIREWVLSLEVVTGAGQILKLNRDLIKNNAGLDLRHLFVGSEGILGFITEASLRITNPPKEPQVLLLGIMDLSQSIEVLKRFQSALSVTAFEFFTDKALQYVLRAAPELAAPFKNSTSFYLLIEFEKDSDAAVDRALDEFEKLQGAGIVSEGALSQNETQFKSFWSYRERISESLSSYRPFKADISVRVSKVPEFIRQAEEELERISSTLEVVWFGHIGDGNLHINLLPQGTGQSAEEFKKECDRSSEPLFNLLASFEGSVSAEHGIGLLKKSLLPLSRSIEEIEIMRKLKEVFDPEGIMNPGKVL